MSERKLDVIVRRLMKKFVGSDPVQLEQAMKELEAGTLVVEVVPDAPGCGGGRCPATGADQESRAERKKEHWEP